MALKPSIATGAPLPPLSPKTRWGAPVAPRWCLPPVPPGPSADVLAGLEPAARLQIAQRRGEDEPLEIVCECDRLDCSERLSVTAEVYERVRSDSSCFFVTAGHEDAAVEEVVDTGGGHLIVRKHLGEPQAIA